MMMFIAILFIVIGVIGILIIANKSTCKGKDFILLFILLLGIGGILFCEAYPCESPQAIDVYRNKTKLVITETLKNGVIIKKDTIVEFK